MSLHRAHPFLAAVASSRSRLATIACAILLGLSPLLARAEPPNVAQVQARIVLALRGPAYAPLRGQITFRQELQNGATPRTLALEGSSAVAWLPANSTWEVSVSIPGYWCRRETLQLGPSGSQAEQPIDTWPLGTLSGSVPKLAAPIKELEIDARPPRSATVRQDRSPKGVFTCPVGADQMWTCAGVPAATYDLILSVKGFAPEYRWTAQVPPGANLDLGSLALRPGASIAGWVQAAVGGEVGPDCLIKLSPAEVTDTTPALTAKVQEEGFFQLTGVRPGTYLLEVNQPDYQSPKVPVTVILPDSTTYLKGAFVLQRKP